MTNLTDEKRKELTLFLGECWHEYPGSGYRIRDDYYERRKIVMHPKRYANCIHCGTSARFANNHRTFTTPDDMVALAKRMVEKGVWHRFELFCRDVYEMEKPIPRENFCAWLLTDPKRFAWLVSEFLTKTEVK